MWHCFHFIVACCVALWNMAEYNENNDYKKSEG